jgi:glycosyltransferase involved in cell wall biosynthesis
LPETIEHGRTGFLVDNVEAMATAIEAAHAIDPEACRRVARERFSMERMVESYFAVYRQLAGISPPSRRAVA